MADANSFSKLVPGFDFLQSLVQNAGAALPNMGQWVAPTLNPEELEKRIEELKTVQFWLEQNARLLGATIQALEVQRMTLSTLKTMNVQMGDLRDSMRIRIPGLNPAETEPTPPAAPPAPASVAAAAPTEPTGSPDTDKTAAPAGVVDPMQWWGALTKQFTELATAAMKDNPAAAIAKQSIDAASEGLKKVMKPAAVAALTEPAAKARPAAKKKPAARQRAAPRRA